MKLLSNYWANLSPKKLENISNFEEWDLTLATYKKNKYKQRPLPKQFQSRRNILYPFIKNWLLGKEFIVSKVRKISNLSSIIVSNLFLRELMLRWPRIKFFRSSKQKRLSFVKKMFLPFEVFWVEIFSFDILFRIYSELQEGPLHIPKDIMLFQYTFSYFIRRQLSITVVV